MRERRNRSQQPARARLRVELLEGRTLPAGGVTALVLAGDLLIIGDRSDNSVEIRVDQGNLVVQGKDGTTVNGDSSAIFEGVDHIADDVQAFLGGGDDSLDIAGLSVGDDVSIRSDGFFSLFLAEGGGDDEVLLDRLTVGGDLSVSTGAGADAVLLERSSINGDTRIATGAGDDRLALVGDGLGDDLKVDLDHGDDKTFVTQTAVTDSTSIHAGSGDDGVFLHGANQFGDRVTLNGGRGKDSAEIDEATIFADRLKVRRFRSGDRVAVTEFSAAEGLAIRALPFGDAPGTGSQDFTLNGVRFTGGEVTFTGVGAAYASAPTTYIAGPSGATLTFDAPVAQVQFFFVHFPGAPSGTATAYDADGNVVAVVHSNQTTFIGDPGNFARLAGDQKIARVEVSGGMIDNVSFVS